MALRLLKALSAPEASPASAPRLEEASEAYAAAHARLLDLRAEDQRLFAEQLEIGKSLPDGLFPPSPEAGVARNAQAARVAELTGVKPEVRTDDAAKSARYRELAVRRADLKLAIEGLEGVV